MRSIIAIIAGIVLWGGLSTVANAALMAGMPGSFDADGFTSSAGIMTLQLAYCVLLSVAAGFVAAWIANPPQMRTVMILALIQLAIGIGVQVSVWERMPLWFHLLLLVSVVPAHLLGGRMQVGQSNDQRPSPV